MKIPRPDPPIELAPEPELPGSPGRGGLWSKLKRGLLMTHTELLERLDAALEGRGTLDQSAIDFLEESLIAADIGVATAGELVERVRRRIRAGEEGDAAALRSFLAGEIGDLLDGIPRWSPLDERPAVVLVVGVNGVGKTTFIAKLAHAEARRGRRSLLVAADTFRAAASDQLARWGERLGVEVVTQRSGADPASVVFDGLQAGRARRVDRVLVDTAGRLHNKEHLMAELAKIQRVVEREAADWQRRTLLVLDATTGQNGLVQAREFRRVASADGIALTKVDGTAKGGVVVAVARELEMPVVYLGVGEGPDDLVEFRPREFAEALFC